MQITEMKAKVGTMDDIKNFVFLLNQFENDVDVSSAQYVVDGKSILGVFSLDLDKPLTVKFHGEVPEELREKLRKYEVTA
jgi:phosphotransferase system HPr-like phosphotransfer protein